MKYLGKSVFHDHYSVFLPCFSYKPIHPISRDGLLEGFGKFPIPVDYYHVFNLLGGFIIGDRSLYVQWAKKTEVFTSQHPNFSEIQSLLIEQPIRKRQVTKVRNYYENAIKKNGEIKCTLSGKTIYALEDLHIDHLLPYSKYKNNDLWNLVPSLSKENSKKTDRIPSQAILNKRKNLLFRHWENMTAIYPAQFSSETKLSLLGYAKLKHLFISLLGGRVHALQIELIYYLLEKLRIGRAPHGFHQVLAHLYPGLFTWSSRHGLA